MIFDNLLSLLVINVVVYFFSSIVAFLICFFSYKAYKLTKEKKYLYFSMGFILLSASLIFHAIGNLSIYLKIQGCFLENECNLSQQFLFLAHFIHVVLTFLAYTILVLIYSKEKDRNLVIFTFIEAMLLAFLTYNSYLFNLIGFVFMAFISYIALSKYLPNKNRSALLAFVAFSFIGISHALFLLSYAFPGYAFLFFGYLSFLLIFKRQITKSKNNGTKKK